MENEVPTFVEEISHQSILKKNLPPIQIRRKHLRFDIEIPENCDFLKNLLDDDLYYKIDSISYEKFRFLCENLLPSKFKPIFQEKDDRNSHMNGVTNGYDHGNSLVNENGNYLQVEQSQYLCDWMSTGENSDDFDNSDDDIPNNDNCDSTNNFRISGDLPGWNPNNIDVFTLNTRLKNLPQSYDDLRQNFTSSTPLLSKIFDLFKILQDNFKKFETNYVSIIMARNVQNKESTHIQKKEDQHLELVIRIVKLFKEFVEKILIIPYDENYYENLFKVYYDFSSGSDQDFIIKYFKKYGTDATENTSKLFEIFFCILNQTKNVFGSIGHVSGYLEEQAGRIQTALNYTLEECNYSIQEQDEIKYLMTIARTFETANPPMKLQFNSNKRNRIVAEMQVFLEKIDPNGDGNLPMRNVSAHANQFCQATVPPKERFNIFLLQDRIVLAKYSQRFVFDTIYL